MMQAELEKTESILDGGDEVEIGSLSGQDITGTLLSATILNYLATNDLQDQIEARSAGVVTYQQPSYGKFSTRFSTSYWFGIPRNINFDGLVMDVDRLASSITSVENTAEDRLSFMRVSGARASAYEHLIPEEMFSSEEERAHGVSAVKALALASSSGQKIWTIDQTNIDIALASIKHSSDIEAEIRNSVRAGKVATIHEEPVFYVGSSFVGYILLDPVTGAGAYKIGGGENGGILKEIAEILEGVIAWLSAFEKSLGKLGVLGAAIKKFVGQAKRLVRNIKSLVEIWSVCNPGFALLGTVFTLIAAFMVFKLAVWATFWASAIGTGLCGPLCGGAAALAVTYFALESINSIFESITGSIISGCSGS